MKKHSQRQVWDSFFKLPDDSEVLCVKRDKWVSFQVRYEGKYLVLWEFTIAEPGEGLMVWQDYKERVKTM